MKKIIPIILSLAFCFSLAACGGNNTTSSMMESGNTSDMLTSSKNESIFFIYSSLLNLEKTPNNSALFRALGKGNLSMSKYPSN